MSFGFVEIFALVMAGIGVVVAFAGRWRSGLGVWARALIVSACAVGACTYMWDAGWTPSAFVAGFLVCAALHRWIDALNAGKAEAAE
jgi:hypothetical protein